MPSASNLGSSADAFRPGHSVPQTPRIEHHPLEPSRLSLSPAELRVELTLLSQQPNRTALPAFITTTIVPSLPKMYEHTVEGRAKVR